jgi:uncharacterized membrane protein YedE/YeeE
LPLILTGQAPLHWAVTGAVIAAVTLLLLFVTNHRLGVSSGFDDLCSLSLPVPYLRRREVASGRKWRLPFVFGMLLGGVLSAALSHGLRPIWDLGPLDAAFGLSHGGKIAWMFGGGLLTGFGTRLAGGCTAGHGIFGVSNFERASFASTLTFLATGIATTALIYGVLAP